MAPFIALSSLFLLFFGLGAVGVHALAGWFTPLRFALAGMFLLTASAHWGKRRPDLVRMIPPTPVSIGAVCLKARRDGGDRAPYLPPPPSRIARSSDALKPSMTAWSGCAARFITSSRLTSST